MLFNSNLRVYLTFCDPEHISWMSSGSVCLKDYNIGHKFTIEALVLNLTARLDVGPTTIVCLVSCYNGHHLVSGQLSVLQTFIKWQFY